LEAGVEGKAAGVEALAASGDCRGTARGAAAGRELVAGAASPGPAAKPSSVAKGVREA
jgi:hypothetical protein